MTTKASGACLMRITVFLALTAGCGSTPTSPAPTPVPSPTPSPSPAPAPTIARYHVTGRVTQENGSPLSGAGVEVQYREGGGGFSDPPAHCHSLGCWLLARTDPAGQYDVTFEPGPGSVFLAQGAGVMSGWMEGFAPNIQLLPRGPAEIVQNLRLRPVRRIDVGQSIELTVEPDSSLCSDLEDLFALTYRCEFVNVVAPIPGTLLVEIRAAPGGVTPTVFWTTSGNYVGPITRNPDISTAPIQIRGGTYGILAGIPAGSAPQRLTAHTSMK
jgi:hypothetical protein